MVYNKLKSWLLVVLCSSFLLTFLFAGLYSSISVINSPIDVRIYGVDDSLFNKINVFGTSPLNTHLPIPYNSSSKSWQYKYFRPYKTINIKWLQSTSCIKFDSILFTLGNQQSIIITNKQFAEALQTSGNDTVDISSYNREVFFQKFISMVYFKPFRILLYALILELILIISLVYKTKLIKGLNSLKILYSQLILQPILFLVKRLKMRKSQISYDLCKMAASTLSLARLSSGMIMTKAKRKCVQYKWSILRECHKYFDFIKRILLTLYSKFTTLGSFIANLLYKNPVNLILIFLGVFFTAYFINVVIMLFSYNNDLGYGVEYVIMYHFQILKETGNFFRDSAKPPFIPNFYLPLYFYITYIIQKFVLCGCFSNIYSSYVIGRIISLLAFSGTLAVVFQILTRQLKVSKKTGFISVILIFILSFSQSFIFRPDSLKTFFFIFSIYLFINYKIHRKKYFIILFSVTSILAFYTKQDGLIVSAIIFFLLLSNKNIFPIISFIIFSIITAFALFLIIYLFDPSILLFTQMDAINIDGISFWYLYHWFLPYIIKILPAVLLILYLSYKYFIKERINDYARKTILVSALFTFFSTLILSLKNGATLYYFSEFQIFAIIIIAYFIEKKAPVINQPKKILFLILFTLYIVALLNYKNIIKVNSKASVNYKMSWYDKKKEKEMRNRYFNAEIFYKHFIARYHLKEDEYLIGFDIYVNIFAADKFFNADLGYFLTAWMEYFTNEKFAYRKTLFQLDVYYKYYDDGHVKYIIFPDIDKGKSFIKEFFPNYCVDSKFDGFIVYRWTANGKVKRIFIK